jgi:hypothetical protein
LSRFTAAESSFGASDRQLGTLTILRLLDALPRSQVQQPPSKIDSDCQIKKAQQGCAQKHSTGKVVGAGRGCDRESTVLRVEPQECAADNCASHVRD